MNILSATLVFLAYFIVDALYALYTIFIGKQKAKSAATIGAIMYGLLAYGTFTFSHDPRYIIFVVLGSWCGTYVAVKYNGNL